MDYLDLEAEVGEQQPCHVRHRRLVIHHQCPSRLLRHQSFRLGAQRRGDPIRGRQVDVNGGSLPRRGLDADVTAVAPHDGMRGRQAEPRAPGLGGVVGVEDPVEALRGYADAPVGDLDVEVAAGRQW